MKLCINVVALSLACVVSVKSDTSYLPPPASGGPYPAASSTPASAPYPPSGWKPSGQPFSLPPRQNPYSSQTSPQQFYGSPKATSRYPTDVEFTTVEPVTSPRPEPESENLNEFATEERIPDSGLYYVLLPDGRLQKVTYVTMPVEETVGKFQVEPRTKDQNVHGYSANIKYQDVEPIRGPVYAYNPAPLIRIFK